MQLEEQFICGLNDEEMLAEITRELTKYDENISILSVNLLTLVKRIVMYDSAGCE